MPRKKKEDMVLDVETGELVSREENMRSAGKSAKKQLDGDMKRGYRKRGATDESVMVSFRMPKDVKARVKDAADARGRSQSEQMIESIECGLSVENAMEAVRDCLSKFPPPFAADGWTPSDSECLGFILESTMTAISRRESQLGKE